MIGVVVAVGAIAVGTFAFMQSDRAEPVAVTAAAAPTPEATPPAPAPIPAPAVVLKPHPQKELPTLQLPGYPLGRSPEVITAAYKFAAEHPEILTYVPCFCGCERMGHRGNEDCFVKARDVNGDVVAWEDHGMECAVCLDVATRARQMYTSGASVSDIRAAVEKEFTPLSTNHTPTPEAPHNH